MMHVKEMFEIMRKTPHTQIAICTNNYGASFKKGQFVLVHEKNSTYTIAGIYFSAEKFNNYFETIYDEDDITDADLINAINMSTIFAGFKDVEEFKVQFKINNLNCTISFANTLYDVRYNDYYGECHDVTFGSPFEVINFLQEIYNEGLASNITGYSANYNPETNQFEIIEKDGLHPYDSSTYPESNTSSVFKDFYINRDDIETDVEFLNNSMVKDWKDVPDIPYPKGKLVYPKVFTCKECGKYFVAWKHLKEIKRDKPDRTHCLDCINKISSEQKAVWREQEAVHVDYFGK